MAAESYLERYARELTDANLPFPNAIIQNDIECMEQDYVREGGYDNYKMCMDNMGAAVLVTTLPPNLDRRFTFGPTTADGNCLFHAVAEGMKLHDRESRHNHITLRQLVCTYYQKNNDDLPIAAASHYGEDTLSNRRKYIEYICKNASFGLGSEVAILSRITPYHIEVYNSNGERTTGIPPENKRVIYLWNHRLTVGAPEPNHYTLLIPKAVAAAPAVAPVAVASRVVAPAAVAPAPRAPVSSLANLAKLSQSVVARAQADNSNQAFIKQQQEQLDRLAREKAAREEAATQRLLAQFAAENEQIRRDAEFAKSLENQRGGSLANLAKLK